MAKFILACFVVASLALSAFGAAIPANDATKAGDVPCIACELLGGVVEFELAQDKSQSDIVQNIKALCGKLPKPFQITCKDFIQHDMTTFVAAVASSGGNLKKACQSVGECKSADFVAQALVNELMAQNPLECLNCKLLAALINNALQHGATVEQIENDALNFCSKLLPPIKDSCTNIVTNQLNAFLQDIKNANGDAGKACVAFGKCKTEEKSVNGDSPLECAVCKVEGGLLKAALINGRNATAIEQTMLNICMKLPAPLNGVCANKVSTDIAPLLDQLTSNGVDVQKACIAVQRCHAEMEAEELENPLDCVACKAVAVAAEVALKQGQTKEQIDADVKQLCDHLINPLKDQCVKQIDTLDSLLAALGSNNGDATAACKAIKKCPTKFGQHHCRAGCRPTPSGCDCI